MGDIALVTERRYESPAQPDWYVRNIVEEDRLLSEALARRGLSTQRVDWARPDVDWGGFSAAVLRTTWDYFDHVDAFRSWIARVQHQTRLFNDAPTVLDNIDKHYLLRLAGQGIEIVPTTILEAGQVATLSEVMAERGWRRAVLKPAVSGGGANTFVVEPESVATHEATLARMLPERAMLVQPFVPSIVTRGEVTVVVIDGHATHSLLKRARPGEFRVQDEHGGTLHDHVATPAEQALARDAIACIVPRPLYGRVDMVQGIDGRPRVMELELVEPELWLRREPAAADRLAEALAARLG